jgi:hypothetical protein
MRNRAKEEDLPSKIVNSGSEILVPHSHDGLSVSQTSRPRPDITLLEGHAERRRGPDRHLERETF